MAGSFPKFGLLPLEIRIQIWHDVIPPPRIVHIEEYICDDPSKLGENVNGLLGIRSWSKPPALLFANRESFALTSRYYKRAFGHRHGMPPQTWFDFERDILFISEHSLHPRRRAQPNGPGGINWNEYGLKCIDTDFNLVKNLAIDTTRAYDTTNTNVTGAGGELEDFAAYILGTFGAVENFYSVFDTDLGHWRRDTEAKSDLTFWDVPEDGAMTVEEALAAYGRIYNDSWKSQRPLFTDFTEYQIDDSQLITELGLLRARQHWISRTSEKLVNASSDSETAEKGGSRYDQEKGNWVWEASSTGVQRFWKMPNLYNTVVVSPLIEQRLQLDRGGYYEEVENNIAKHQQHHGGRCGCEDRDSKNVLWYIFSNQI
jgi:hypothetical protein